MNDPLHDSEFKHTWEQAIEILRRDPAHRDLIYQAYLTNDLMDNCRRFASSGEFQEVLKLLSLHGGGRRLLDIPAGNGIATFAFTKAGYEVTAVDPDGSASLGRAAIERVLAQSALTAEIVEAYGESLPFAAERFDIIYVRQGLHHASDLPRMLREFARVLKPGGILLACREHVVDDYGASLRAFLDAQVDHKLYGGENAFILGDYRNAIRAAGLSLLQEFDPIGSVINLAPDTPQALAERLLNSKAGRLLKLVMPGTAVIKLGHWLLRSRRTPGRLYSFLARKPLN